MATNRKVVLITGASSGIGEAAAIEMLKTNWIVYGAARRVERMAALASQGLRPLHLDVTDLASRQQAVSQIIQETGRLDGLVNNAGYGSYGSLEEVPMTEAKRQFDVNVFGLVGMCQEVLPIMRQQQGGRVVNVASMGGRIYTPMGGWYYATKHAVEALSDCLRQEVKSFGLKVSIIEPGIIKSEWSQHSLDSLLAVSGNGPYQGLAQKLNKVMSYGYQDKLAGKPSVIGHLIAHALTSRRPRIRYAAPIDAKVLLAARKYLPDAIFDALVSLVCGA